MPLLRCFDAGRFEGLDGRFLEWPGKPSPDAPGLAGIEEHEKGQITDTGQIQAA